MVTAEKLNSDSDCNWEVDALAESPRGFSSRFTVQVDALRFQIAQPSTAPRSDTTVPPSPFMV